MRSTNENLGLLYSFIQQIEQETCSESFSCPDFSNEENNTAWNDILQSLQKIIINQSKYRSDLTRAQIILHQTQVVQTANFRPVLPEIPIHTNIMLTSKKPETCRTVIPIDENQHLRMLHESAIAVSAPAISPPISEDLRLMLTTTTTTSTSKVYNNSNNNIYWLFYLMYPSLTTIFFYLLVYYISI